MLRKVDRRYCGDEMLAVPASAVAGIFQGISERGSERWLRGLAEVLTGTALAISVVAPPLAEIFAGIIVGRILGGKKEGLKAATFFLIYSIVPKVVYFTPFFFAAVVGYLDVKKTKGMLLPIGAVLASPWAGVPALALVAYWTGVEVTRIIYRWRQGS